MGRQPAANIAPEKLYMCKVFSAQKTLHVHLLHIEIEKIRRNYKNGRTCKVFLGPIGLVKYRSRKTLHVQVGQKNFTCGCLGLSGFIFAGPGAGRGPNLAARHSEIS